MSPSQCGIETSQSQSLSKLRLPSISGRYDFEMELARATPEEKEACLERVTLRQTIAGDATTAALAQLQNVARLGGNVFEELMETVKVASLGQITDALFNVGGQYRRNM